MSDDPTPSLERDNSTRRHLRDIASELWHQKPGPRAPRAPRPLPADAKEVVNGLDQRERMLGFAATFITIGTSVWGYSVEHHSKVASTRAIAPDLLVAGLILGALMGLGTVLRRRALLGFAAFMTGFELITGGDIAGIVFLGFGGWLIVRVMRKQKMDRAAAGGTSAPAPRASRQRAAAIPKAPKASKRYTPPRTGAGRRR